MQSSLLQVLGVGHVPRAFDDMHESPTCVIDSVVITRYMSRCLASVRPLQRACCLQTLQGLQATNLAEASCNIQSRSQMSFTSACESVMRPACTHYLQSQRMTSA